MVIVASDGFFYRLFRKTPWYVSPVRVPCQRCAIYDPPYPSSARCKHRKRFDFTCADHAGTIPVFKKHNEASSIQLFYDLFFVANLSICTTNHPVKDSSSLSTYIGFFALLWFTWFSTIIFDVRFAIDSWFTRLSKAFSFGIMTAFAMSTVYFDVEKEEQFGHDAEMTSLILMASRLFLVIQYLVTMIAVYYRYRDKSVITPFALTICTSLAAAFIFLGLHFFKFKKHTYGYVGWFVPLPLRPTCANVTLTQQRYVTSVAEAAALLAISYFFSDLMKFDDSNIVERMGALTLIIIGEGIIGMTEKVSFILKTSSKISASSAGLIASAVLVIYILWMLYFDHTDMLDRPGSRINKTKPWVQLWAFLHFPLHTAILITVEGGAIFISWWNAHEALNFLSWNFDMPWDYPPYVQNGTQLAHGVRLQLKNITGAYPYLVETVNSTDFHANLTKIQNLGTFVGLSESTYNDTYNNLSDLLHYMNDALFVRICDLFDFDFDIPEAQTNSDALADLIYKASADWFVAFFVAAGCVLIVLALARYVGHQGPSSKSGPLLELDRRDKKRRIAWVAITMQCLIGIGLTLVSLLALPKYAIGRWSNFISSPWIIPTVLLAFSSGKSISVIRMCILTNIFPCSNRL
jgi:Bacterial low temperature requirement A protein (LtrA)